MATLTIKNVPDDLYELIKLRAKANRRSINNEMIRIMEQAINSYKIDPQEMIEEARKIRESIDYVVTDEELEAWINEGRP